MGDNTENNTERMEKNIETDKKVKELENENNNSDDTLNNVSDAEKKETVENTKEEEMDDDKLLEELGDDVKEIPSAQDVTDEDILQDEELQKVKEADNKDVIDKKEEAKVETADKTEKDTNTTETEEIPNEATEKGEKPENTTGENTDPKDSSNKESKKRKPEDDAFGTTSNIKREKKIESATFNSGSAFSAFASSNDSTTLFANTNSTNGTSSIFAKQTTAIFGGTTATNDSETTDVFKKDNSAIFGGQGDNSGIFAAQTTSIFNNSNEQKLGGKSDIKTGEEHEEVVLQTKSKLYRLQQAKGETKSLWKELGTGLLKINIEKGTLGAPQKPRMVMRQDGVLKLVLNAPIFPEMPVEKVSEKMLRFSCTSAVEDSALGLSSGLATFLLKLPRAEQRDELLSAIQKMKDTQKLDA